MVWLLAVGEVGSVLGGWLLAVGCLLLGKRRACKGISDGEIKGLLVGW